MVVRLQGKIQGNDVIFNLIEGDIWETIIPQSLNGVYIVELTAFDDSGNSAYTSRYILTVDMASLSVKIMPFNFYGEFSLKKRKTNIRIGKYYSKVRCCKC